MLRHASRLLTTRELVGRVGRGDAEAFALLLGRFEAAALAVAYGVLLNSDSARDAVQVAALKAWRRIGDLREPERFGAWLCRITYKAACDQRRKKIAVPVAAQEQASPADEAARRESHQRVAAALVRLDEISRTIVMLRYFQDLSSKEIGKLLELSPGAVDMRLSRARGQLREMLSGSLSAGVRGSI